MIAKSDIHFNRVIGIDLGGGKGKTTSVAVGQANPTGLEIVSMGTRSPSGLPWYDQELVPFLREQPRGTLVAIDAPLGLPACLRCLDPRCAGYAACPDPAVAWMRSQGERLDEQIRRRVARGKPRITPYTQRVTEILLRHDTGILPRETLGQGMGPLTARAAHLVRSLTDRYPRDVRLLEVYPKATIGQLAGAEAATSYKRRAGTWATRAGLLEAWSQDLSFRIWREESLRCDHTFDAVVCAYTGWRWATEGWSLPDPALTDIVSREGWIWYPPAAG